jgi:hypothetical protein
VYNVHGKKIQVRQATDGVKLGEVDFGEHALGSPILANGRVFVTGRFGKVAAYSTANQPPTNPDTFSPFNGEDLTTTNTPTLTWANHADAESAVANLTVELQIGVGYANRDLELSTSAPVVLGGGSSSYLMGSVANNTHVYWRVRVQDPNGAYSPWTDTQDFWINRDTTPPDPIDNLTAVAGDSSVAVSWDASPSVDLMLYRLWYKESTDVWSNATLVDDITGLSYNVTGLTNGILYDFMVVAVDAGENESTTQTVSAQPRASASIIGGGDYATVQGALDASVSGDSVVIASGTHNEDLVVPAGVSIQGAAPNGTIIRGTGAGTVIDVQGTYGVDPQTIISDLTVENGTVGIDGGDADVLVQNVIVYGMLSHAIESDLASRLQVVNCTLNDNGGDGIYSAGEVESRNNIVGNNGGVGINVPITANVNYNSAYNNTLGDLAPGVSGTRNISRVAVFTDEAANDYTVLSSSPTVDRGDEFDDYTNEPSPNGGRVNQGAFGNTAWAATSTRSASGDSSGGACGSIGLDLMFPLLFLLWYRRRRLG